MKKNNLRSYWGILAQIPLALVVLLMLAVSACEPEADTGNASNLPTELQNTKWIHRDGDRVEFGTNTVKVIPVSGTGKTFTLQDSATVSALSMTTLYFGSSKTADFIVYLDGTIDSVGLGGVEKTGFWQQDTGNGYIETLAPSVQLTEANWQAILNGIAEAGNNVILDLSGCTRSGENTGEGLRADGTFLTLNRNDAGQRRIVSLILPNTTTSIVGDFWYFSRLTSISFPASISFSDNPFYKLSTVSFILTGTGSLSTIEDGKALVQNNTELVAYPAASGNITLNNITSIGSSAFSGCTKLTSVDIPNAISIGKQAFLGCKSLPSVSFPKVTSIGFSAFAYCSSLTSVNFPAAISIGGNRSDGGAFAYCSSLTSVSFPVATSIGPSAFAYCSKLTSVNIPKVTSIGYNAFREGTTAITIILGPIAPALNTPVSVYDGLKTITVKVPYGATGYGTTSFPATYSGTDTTENWGNGFRGGGWNGTGFYVDDYGYGGASSIDTKITLHIQQQ